MYTSKMQSFFFCLSVMKFNMIFCLTIRFVISINVFLNQIILKSIDFFRESSYKNDEII